MLPTLLLASLLSVAHAADLDFGYVQNPGPTEQPTLLLTHRLRVTRRCSKRLQT